MNHPAAAGRRTHLYEPYALVGMQVPANLSSLWAQRRRWARGQGEVLHNHWREVLSFRNRSLWGVALESSLSLVWVLLAVVALVLWIVAVVLDANPRAIALTLAWGIAIGVVALFQLAFAIIVERRYDHPLPWVYALGPIYPIAWWLISAAAAVRAEVVALVRGPREQRVVWDLPREQIEG